MAYFNNLTVGGTAKFLQDVKWPGLKSTVDELNYLHKGITKKDGWYIPTKGDGVYGDHIVWYNSTKLGLIEGNTYTVTFTDLEGQTVVESIVAADASSDMEVNYPVIALKSEEWENYIFFDGLHYDISRDEPAPAEGGSMWFTPTALDCASIMIEGTVTSGTLTHEDYSYNQIPAEHM